MENETGRADAGSYQSSVMAGRYIRTVLDRKKVKITAELPNGKGDFCREKQMFAVRGTVPRNKEKRAVRKDKTDRPILGNSIDTRPEV